MIAIDEVNDNTTVSSRSVTQLFNNCTAGLCDITIYVHIKRFHRQTDTMLYNLHNVLQLYKEYAFFGILISSVICQAAIDQPLQLHKQAA